MLGKSSEGVIAGRLRPSVSGALSRFKLSAIQWLILGAAGLVLAISLGTGYIALQYRELIHC